MSNMEAVSISEAQAIIGLGKTKIYELLKTGEIPAKKVFRRTIILRSDLDNFLNNLESYPVENGGYNGKD